MAQNRILGMDPYIEAQRWRGFHANGNTTIAVQPALRIIPVLAAQQERFIQIYTLSNRQLVTVIELLFPSNERPSSLGRSEYLEKRQRLLQAGMHSWRAVIGSLSSKSTTGDWGNRCFQKILMSG